MAIENFTAARFEAVLELAWRGKWEKSNDAGQVMYSIRIEGPFSILIFSSIMVSGVSSKSAGQDSIRAVITKDGKPWGGKPVRWIDRRSGWDERLIEYLGQLSHQISWLKQPCPACQTCLVPFVARKGKEENKGRPFVACKKSDCKSPFWAWCETESGTPITPLEASNNMESNNVVSQGNQATQDAPECPECGKHPMVRMGSGKGWRCGAPGNRWNRGLKKWSVCNGSIFDKNTTPTSETTPAETTPAETTPALMRSAGIVQGFKLPASELVSAVKKAIGHLDDDELDAARTLLYKLLEE